MAEPKEGSPRIAEDVDTVEDGIAFKQYGSFENLTGADVDEIAGLPIGAETWVVLEKIHGSNFSFITDGSNVEVAKRTSLLPPGAKFFSFRGVLERYRNNVLEAFHSVKRRYPTTKRVHIFGELYGGLYAHPKVAAVPGEVFVQKQIQYSPRDEFAAFDISTGKGFLDFDVAMEVFAESGIPFVRPLFVGTFAEAAAFDPVFPTTIPATHGLPRIKGNNAEGVLIKRMRGSRPIFKHKNPMFAEITGPKDPQKAAEFRARREATARANKARALQASSAAGQRGRETEKENEKEVAVGLPARPLTAVELAAAYVNENRLMSVASKEGEISPENAERLKELLGKDAFNDFAKDRAREMGLKGGAGEWKKKAPKEDVLAVRKLIPKLAADVVDAHFRGKGTC